MAYVVVFFLGYVMTSLVLGLLAWLVFGLLWMVMLLCLLPVSVGKWWLGRTQQSPVPDGPPLVEPQRIMHLDAYEYPDGRIIYQLQLEDRRHHVETQDVCG